MKREDLSEIIETAGLLNRTLRKLIVTERGVHAETIISASSRMTGTLLLRHVAPEVADLQPGSKLISETANRQGQTLMRTMFATLKQLGHNDLDEDGLQGRQDSTDQSQLSLSETQARLDPWFVAIAKARRQSLDEVAVAGAITTAMLIHECRPVLDMHAGCAIAIYGLVEATRTVPVTVNAAA